MNLVNQVQELSKPKAKVLFLSCLIFQLMGGLIILQKNKKQKHKLWKNRRWWVRPMNLLRDDLHFSTFVEELKNDADLFFRYTRMTLEIYNNLLEKLSPFLVKTSFRKPLTPEQRFLITLRYLFKVYNI